MKVYFIYPGHSLKVLLPLQRIQSAYSKPYQQSEIYIYIYREREREGERERKRFQATCRI